MKRIALLSVLFFLPLLATAGSGVVITNAKGKLVVKINGKLFTEYHYAGVPKPVLYPVHWTDGTPMTRRYPMEKALPGESADHKHHRSLWWGHRHVKGGKAVNIVAVTETADWVEESWTEPSSTEELLAGETPRNLKNREALGLC